MDLAQNMVECYQNVINFYNKFFYAQVVSLEIILKDKVW
jgi:hypothetical protein